MTGSSKSDFERLTELALLYHAEAVQCAEQRCFLAGCVMIGSALEAGLAAMSYIFEEEARAAGLWPKKDSPLYWRLDQLLRLGQEMKWLPSSFAQDEDPEYEDIAARAQVGDFADNYVRPLRNLVHPGRLVRDFGDGFPGEEQLSASYEVVRAAFDHLHAELDQLPIST